MLTPPYLLSAAALFWAWQAGVWPMGLALALALEAPRWIAKRIQFEPLQWNRIADLCTALFILVIAYVWVAGGARPVVVRAFHWLPIAFVPLALAQVWATERKVALSALFISLRRVPEEERGRIPRIDLGWPFLAVLIVGAAAANSRTPGVFYTGLAVLAGWALWQSRSKRYRARTWLAAFAFASALGYGGALGLSAAQGWLEDALSDFLSGLANRTDPYRSLTAMGTIGELKRSGRIVLRIYPGPDAQAPALPEAQAPPLLQQASYNAYFAETWLARAAPLGALAPSGDGATWRLADPAENARELRIVNDLDGGAAVLPLPPGAFQIARLVADELKQNRLGTVQARVPAARADYNVRYSDKAARAAPPSEDDLVIPAAERAALEAAYREAGLEGLPPAEQVNRLRAWLAQRFRYSTYRAETTGGSRSATPGASRSALTEFLQHTRAGHCEYFASATVLLLRRAGIPARYATGFAVHEWSDLEGAYVARLRDAHAWALAWRDGAWQAVDTTPENWLELESEQITRWRRVADFGSWASYRLARLREGDGGTGWVLALGGVLALWLAWRIGLRRQNAARLPLLRGEAKKALDSPWYAVEARLAKLGHARHPSETPREYASRVGRSEPRLAGGLDDLVALHYRYRFDPALEPESAKGPLKQALQQQVNRWLADSASSVQ